MAPRFALVLAFLVLSALPIAVRAEEPAPGPADAAAIRAVISDQLGAFLRDDQTAAFADASGAGRPPSFPAAAVALVVIASPLPCA